MCSVVVMSVENGQQNQSTRADDGKKDAQDGKNLFFPRRVGHESSVVTQQTLRGKRQIQEDGRDDGSGDEERL